MKLMSALCWVSLSIAMGVQAQPVAADFCMFQVDQGGRVDEHGARFPDLLDYMVELEDTANPVFIQRPDRQWHLDRDLKLVREEGSAQLAALHKNFAVAPDGSVWNASGGRLHVRRPGDEVFQAVVMDASPANLRDEAPIVWSSLYGAIVLAGEQGLYVLRGERLEPLPISEGVEPDRIFFLRDLPQFKTLAIGDIENNYFMLNAAGRLQHMKEVKASDRYWWFSDVTELHEQQAVVLSSSHESFLLPIERQDGVAVVQQARPAPRVIGPGSPAIADVGRYFSAVDSFLAFGRVADWWPFRHTALQRLDAEGWQAVASADQQALGERPVLWNLPSRKLVLISGRDRLFTYSSEVGLSAVPGSEVASIGLHAWATELVDMDKVVVRSSHGLFELTGDGRLVPLAPLEVLASSRVTDVVALPGVPAALVLTDRSAFVLTADNRLLSLHSTPTPQPFDFGDLALGIVGRNAAFFQARNGHFVVTTRESGRCPQE